MGALTPRADLYLPGTGSTGLIVPDEVADIDKLNDNFRKIDALLGARNIPSASSYGGNMDGDLVYAQDTGFLHIVSALSGQLELPNVDPSQLPNASDSVEGLVRFATQGEADGAVEEEAALTPKTLRNAAGLPFAMAAGKLYVTSGPSGTPTFPSGRFTVPPVVIVLANTPDGGVVSVPYVTGITKNGFVVSMYGLAGARNGGWIHWLAVQMASGSAEG